MRGWAGRRPAAQQRRAEAAARGRIGAAVRAARKFEPPLPATPTPTLPTPTPPALPTDDEIRSTVDDAVWEALQGRREAAIEMAHELLAFPLPEYMIAIRAQYEKADGTIVWVTLAPLTPLAELPVLVLAVAERGALTLTAGYWRDADGVSVPAVLVRVETYLRAAADE